MIAVLCPHCGRKIKAKDAWAGCEVHCPACRQLLRIPKGEFQGAGPPRQATVDSGNAGEPAGAPGDPQRTEQRYAVVDEIGRGGMGAVMRANDRQIRREVAVKYLLNQADAAKKARFIEEAQITGQLEHPNIVPVHELGLDAEGRLYFTMKMVRGRSLKDVLDELRQGAQPGGQAEWSDWSLSRLLGVLVNVCHALAYAHSRGVVHRDLKPANIMVGDFGEVYVMDWGLAKVLASATADESANGAADPTLTAGTTAAGDGHDSVTGSGSSSSAGVVSTDRAGDATALTMDGSILGTPVYMPPEQASGDIRAIDPRSDVYSLGAILYELLTLEPPVDKSGGHIAVLSRVVQGEIVPPAKRAADRARAGLIPKELAAVAMKSLALKPADRYQSAEVLRRDIELFLEGRSVSAKQDSALELAKKFVKRNKGLSAGLATALLVLLVSLGFLFSAWHETSSAYAAYASEQSERQKAIEHALPALAISARQLAGDGNVAAALSQIEVTLLYDPGNAEARLLKSQLLMAQERWADGRAELEQYEKLKPGDAQVRKLRELSERGEAREPAVWFELVQYLQEHRLTMPANQLLQKAQAAAKSREPLLALYNKQIDAHWPGHAVGLSNGMLTFYNQYSPLRTQVTHLGPLKGIPLEIVRLEGWSKLKDVSAFRGMPLKELYLTESPSLQDITPLRELPLRVLQLYGCASIKDFEPLRGLKLNDLRLDRTNISNLSPLAGMPLRTLTVGNNAALRDLEPLRGMSLTTLNLAFSGRITSLEPLRGMPLVNLDLYGCGLKSIEPLKGMKLSSLNIIGNGPFEDAEPLRGMPLEGELHAHVFRDVSALEGMKLHTVTLDHQNLPKGIEALRRMETLRHIGAGADYTPEEFWKKYDAGEFNPPAKKP
jgi:serine/threonine protein kinase